MKSKMSGTHTFYSLLVALLSHLSLPTLADEDWQPLVHPERYQAVKQPLVIAAQDNFIKYQPVESVATLPIGQCEIYKVVFDQGVESQYVQYQLGIPELKEFTLCFWSKFSSHNVDHPIFSYAVKGQPREIYSWISNTNRSSFISMAVSGQTFFRLNYPLKVNKWFHTCESWNGKTGEWQVWVNSERVGRGFHNRLVGHVIPSGGAAISGQEQLAPEEDYYDRKDTVRDSGMVGSITMLQLYSVALTAGKAHRDHKHHHAHQFDHQGNQITTPPPSTTTPRSPFAQHPLLTGGQINHMVRINVAGGGSTPRPQFVPGVNYDVQFVNGQIVGNVLAQQASGGGPIPYTMGQLPQQTIQLQPHSPIPIQQQAIQQPVPIQPQAIQPPVPIHPQAIQIQPQQPIIPVPHSSQSIRIGDTQLLSAGFVHALPNPRHVQFIDSSSHVDTHDVYKREDAPSGSIDQPRDKRDITKLKSEQNSSTRTVRSSINQKRELVLAGGSIVDDSNFSYDFEQSLLHGLAGIQQNEPILKQQKEYDEREPAEAEVKAVMNVCTGCDEEPFGKALVIAWRSIHKKVYAGAQYIPGGPRCHI